MDSAAVLMGAVLVMALVWLALEIRSLHESMLPVIAIAESPILQQAASLG